MSIQIASFLIAICPLLQLCACARTDAKQLASALEAAVKPVKLPEIRSRKQALANFGSTKDFRDYVSWARFAAVTVLGEADWREKVVRDVLGPEHHEEQVSCGPVFTHDYTFEADMLPYLESTVSATPPHGKDIIFFTATDPAAVGSSTHFISYVIDRRATPGKALYVFNPAVGPRGIQEDPDYQSKVEAKLTDFYQKAGYEVVMWPTTTAPQVTESDVFCQSWSLYTAIEGLKKLTDANLKTDRDLLSTPLDIPSRIGHRNELLLEFWQKQIQLPGFSTILENTYTTTRLEYGNSKKFDDNDKFEAFHLLMYANPADAFAE